MQIEQHIESLDIGETAKPDPLESLAQQIAEQHLHVKPSEGDLLLLHRLEQREEALHSAYRHFVETSKDFLSVAAEWMLDNYYVVQQAIRQIGEDMPHGFYRELPRLATTPLAGYPRIFALAWEITVYHQNQLTVASVMEFIHLYQSQTPLTMGELWALPTMLRLGILEKLAAVLVRLTEIADATEPLPASTPQNVTDETLVGNSIMSLRLLATQDWKVIFEELSQVEQALQDDPAKIYANMDFETRNNYRRVIEILARRTGHDELGIAQQTIGLSEAALQADSTNVTGSHVGFYLVDVGRSQLETALGYRVPWMVSFGRWCLSHPTLTYLGSTALLTLIIILTFAAYAASMGGAILQVIGAGLIAFLPATAVAVGVVNWLVTTNVPPRRLPRMDFQKGIPVNHRAIVVIPAMLTKVEEVDSLVQELELHYLRNPDQNLAFALLTDFADAPNQHMPEDESLIDRAKAGITTLNGKHNLAPFYLFHRERRWNQDRWMGWERKRGKLMEFNRLLRGDPTTSYVVQIGDLDKLPATKYVITLDADTVLPQGSASRLVATLAHPLNQPRFDPVRGKVAAGYGILQPRVEIKPTSANQSLFSQIFAGDAGLDLYTLAVSDVYQDFFGEGSYVGKGLYEIDAFERALANRMPQNALLSHDLFEGIHARAALVTDVILYEDYPSHYLVHMRRQHRWIRGDWQLVPWLLPRVPNPAGGGTIPNYLSAFDRWKIIDNLRRSLVAPALLTLLVVGWLWLPGSPLVWTTLAALTLAVPFLTRIVDSLIQFVSVQTRSVRSLRQIVRPVRLDMMRWLLALVFLCYEALLSLDAIITTLVRVFITRKHLLQWTTAAHTARLFGDDNRSERTLRQMIAVLPAVLVLLYAVLARNVAALPVAAPFLALWLLSPQIADWISLPRIGQDTSLTADQEEELRRLARRTWLFFEQFVGPEDHWLPPDHFQESPRGVVAHRTSPTNIGLLLLSTLSAYDLGYTGLLDLVVRLRATLDALEQLEHYRGHILNWYDTQSLEPLLPRYVSTVDSGNLAASLLALKQGCLALHGAHTMREQRWQGLLDTLTLLTESLQRLAKNVPEAEVAPLRTSLAALRQRVTDVKSQPDQWAAALAWLYGPGWQELSQLIVPLLSTETVALDPGLLNELRVGAERVQHHLNVMQRDMSLLVPWMLPLSEPPELFERLGKENLESDTNSTDLAATWRAFVEAFSPVTPRLNEIDTVCGSILSHLHRLREQIDDEHGTPEQVEAARAWCSRLAIDLSSTRMRVHGLIASFQDLAMRAEAQFQAMDFSFLFNSQRQVFHIGYNVTAGKLDDNYYDLLASEARIASLLAIAKGDVPQSHWLHLARPVTLVGNARALLSWSGSMFEYLMPALVMEVYENTLLAQSCYAAVEHQIAYGKEKNVPWGISEAGYYAFDGNMNYQYRAFGVPGLGFKRGLSEDLVITPYASLLALPLHPHAVMQNIARLREMNMLGPYGFYEAVDFTRSRLPARQNHAIVQSYMAHHQGMIMISLANHLLAEQIVRRFHAEPQVQSVELLLQERIPDQAPVEYPHLEDGMAMRTVQPHLQFAPWHVPADTSLPHVHVLSNGRYSVLVTNAGSGYSLWQNLGLTRWRPDTTLDRWGTWIYVKDCDSGAFWSAGRQPTTSKPDSEAIWFHAHQVEFQRRDHEISLNMEITVAADEDVEIRRITLTNHADRPRQLALLSYGEVMLSPQTERHPAFNKLFIESEYLPEMNTLLFRRRPRSANEAPVYMAHVLVSEQEQEPAAAYEGDRARFIGRYGTQRAPFALREDLSGTVGATLDPVMSLCQEIWMKPHSTASVVFLTLAARSREEALAVVHGYRGWPNIASAFDSARRQAELTLRDLDLDTQTLEATQQLLSAILYPYRALRAAPEILAANHKGQPALWAYGISGDYPILLVCVGDVAEIPLVREALQAHTFWRNQQLMIDLVILNTRDSGYARDLHEQIYRLIGRSSSRTWLNRRGGIFVVSADQMGEEDRVLLQTAARAILDGERGSLAEQVRRLHDQPTPLPLFAPTIFSRETLEATPRLPRPNDLLFDNGYGGFSADGKEYMIYLEAGQTTPSPWINVIANAEAGFLVSESGASCTWAENSGENRLTPWRNDPVSDTPGEALYLRDEETARVWSPTPLPAGDDQPYLIRHGAGYSIFQHHSQGLIQQLQLFVTPNAPVKVIRLRLENTWSHARRITVTYYAEWVLGVTRSAAQPYVVSEFDHASGALLARNAYNIEFGERIAFLAANKTPHGLTADRSEFLGRMGDYRLPTALERIGLASRVQPGLDPCAAIQLHVDLPAGEAQEVYFLLGQGANKVEALELIGRYQDPAEVEAAWQAATAYWDKLLGTITVNTPDQAMNLMLNRWLLYQTLACRVWGRSAFYQSSGAFGYRDQLQDVMGLIHAAPEIAREHILRASRHQFEAGDVLHWWHPPSGRGVRTRFSDDLLWLPYVTAYYVESTGDTAILREETPFLRGEALRPDEEERYGHYETTCESYSLYDHCLRAIKRGSTEGPHGLPLMGTGDWNDGMNRVGVEGRGESVWVGWFMYSVLDHFAPLCETMDDTSQAVISRQQAQRLQVKLEAEAWDGEAGKWYRRAYFDDGTPLGSAQNRECQIDSIAQTWAVLSRAGNPDRAQQAMEAVAERLVRENDQLILLFTPPFDKMRRDPGYIKGYLPGIRENGGQYTHAAIWVAYAHAQLGQGDRAGELFKLLNPILHADTPEKANRYKVEPYVIAADVYSVPPHTGRGGWTWYTGSASWMYRLGIEAILGIRREGEVLHIDPCIPSDWPSYQISYRYGETVYVIEIDNPQGVSRGIVEITMNGEVLPADSIRLQNDGHRHEITVRLGSGKPTEI